MHINSAQCPLIMSSNIFLEHTNLETEKIKIKIRVEFISEHVFYPLKPTSFLTVIVFLHDICLLVTNQNQLSKYSRFTPLKNYTTILTMTLIGLKNNTTFVLTNRPVVLRGLIKVHMKIQQITLSCQIF